MTACHLDDKNDLHKSIDLVEQYIADMSLDLLNNILRDNTTNRNILWATDNYIAYGEAFAPDKEIKPDLIIGEFTNIIQPRASKSVSEQTKRTCDKAEVFTPSWMCNKQINQVDNLWFGRENVFNYEKGKNWIPFKGRIEFPKGKSWKDYVSDIRLEISCGEAPYIVTRYDTVSGKYLSLEKRIGILDRKLRVVSENCKEKNDWIEYSISALKSVYGYEWQGDSLIIARENILYSYLDYYNHNFSEMPSDELMIKISDIISWNFWQMDGTKFVIPNSCKTEVVSHLNLFGDKIEEEHGCEGCVRGNLTRHNGIYSEIMNWEENRVITFASLVNGGLNNE